MASSNLEDDPFDSLLSLEETYYAEGLALGIADGERSGRIEGRLFGLEKGFEKFTAMGRLNGRAQVWTGRLASESGSGVELKGSERLRKHVERLAELTDPESLETKNDEAAVSEFDERVAGAKAKATLIARIVGEVDDGQTGSGGAEDEVPRPASSKTNPTGEMEDFTGLPAAAAVKRN